MPSTVTSARASSSGPQSRHPDLIVGQGKKRQYIAFPTEPNGSRDDPAVPSIAGFWLPGPRADTFIAWADAQQGGDVALAVSKMKAANQVLHDAGTTLPARF
jgi:hypothetical protein